MDLQRSWILTCLMVLNVPVILHGQIDTVNAQDEQPYLLFGSFKRIIRADLDGRNNRTIINQTAVGLDYDYRQRTLYWSDREKIFRANLDGSSITAIVDSDISPEVVAWDWINKKLYWTDPVKKTLEVVDPITGFRKILLSTGGKDSNPRGLVVDPLNRWLYWSDWGKGSERIVRTSMDGTNSTVLHDDSRVTWPNGLTLDYTTQNLYWFDASRNYLGTSRSNGTNFRSIQTFTQGLNPFDTTFFNGVLYNTNWVDNTLRSLTLSAPSPAENRELLRVARDPNGVKVFSLSRQPSLGAGNPCESSGCSHLCLLSATDRRGYSCACPPGEDLSSNGRTCGYEPETTTDHVPAIPGLCDRPNLCQNGGTCVDIDISQFICLCPAGYSGKICEASANTGDEGMQNVSIAVFLGVVGGLVIIVVVMVGVLMLIFAIVKTRSKNNNKKQPRSRAASIEGLSTSSRDSPTHFVVINGRMAAEHDYMSIKSRGNSPAPGRILICNVGENGVIPNNYIFEPRPITSSNGTANQNLQDSFVTSQKPSDNEPIYNTLRATKTQTL